MPIYERYIIRSVIWPFFVSILVLTGLIWISQILRLMFLIENNIFFLQFILTSMMVIPTLLHSVMPFAILYATILAIHNLKLNKELVILQLSGISFAGLVSPIFKLGSLLTIFALINSSYIMPKSYSILKNNLFLFKGNIPTSAIHDGFFNVISPNLVLFINKKTDRSNFDGIVIFDSRKSQNAILIAEKGDLKSKNGALGLNLEHGSRQSFSQGQNLNIVQFDKFRVNIQNERSKARSLNDYDVQELTIFQLLFQKQGLTKATNILRHEANSRLSWAIMNVLLPIAALCIFLKADFNRRESTLNIAKSIAFAIIFVAIHFLILSFSLNMPLLNLLLYINLLIGFTIVYYIIFREG